jgi:hypothetical protein
MKATGFEYRFRLLIQLVLYLIGFLTLWQRLGTIGGKHLWALLAELLFATNHLKGVEAFLLIAVVACVLAVAGAVLSVRGAKSGRPSRHAGTWLTGAAVAILMPPGGALFFVLALGVLQWRLMARDRSDPAASAREKWDSWGMVVAAEAYPIGVAISFLAFAWQYDVRLLTRCVVVCLGLAIAMQALLPKRAGRLED